MKNIIIGNNLLEKLSELFDFDQFSQIAILTDVNIAPHWLDEVKKAVGKESINFIIPAGEKTKNIDQAKIIWKKMLENGLDRKSLLINLGGGVIGDLGGFVASTFMRGIEFLQIPTSLLAMVDASIGGKTAVDLDDVKNIIGTFTLPIGVVIDVATLKTLPKRELVAAFAEIIKHSIIDSRSHFNLVTAKKPEEFSQKELIEIVRKSVQLKWKIVKKDFKETTGLRRTVNFGHTIGHAIETLCLKRKNLLLHGEAIAIGLIAESKLANLMGLLPEKDFVAIEKAIHHAGLPTRIKNISVGDILRVMSFDKKNVNKKIFWSLPEKIGKVNINVEVPKKLVIKAIKSIII